jgi:gamma-glutamylputrescine synthase
MRIHIWWQPLLTGMLYGLENIDEEDLPEPQQDDPFCRCFSRKPLRHLPAVSISPTAWARLFQNSGSPASLLNSTGLSIVTKEESNLA